MRTIQASLGCSDVLFLLFISFVEVQAIPEHRDPLLGLQTHHRFPRSTVRGGFFDVSLISALPVLLAYLVMWEPREPAWPR